jgi:rhamnosyltransferase
MIVAVIVLYHPDRALLAEICAQLCQCVDRIVIADNGCDPEVRAWLQEQPSERLTRLDMGGNRGVGAAQNEGIRYARAQGAGFVLLLDQDSRPAPWMVPRLVQSYRRLEALGEKTAVLAPCYFDSRTGHAGTFLQVRRHGVRHVRCGDGVAREDLLPVDITIASGLLIPCPVLDDVGPMDETLFIDQVDTDWCLRARAKGYGIYVDCQARLEHSLGLKGRWIWFGRWRRMPVHVPLRHYYQWRNVVLVAQRAYAPASWVVATCLGLAAKAGIVAVFGPERIRATAMAVSGLVDGLKGRVGPYGSSSVARAVEPEARR